MRPDLWMRAARRARRVSQRELAERAGVSTSTVANLEAGTLPRLATFVRLLAALDFELAVVDRSGAALEPDLDHERLYDRGGRHFPAHLRAARTPDYGKGSWWGWHRIAFYVRDENVPDFTYWRRSTWPLPGPDGGSGFSE